MSTEEFVTIFVLQESATSEDEAKALLDRAKSQGALGGKIVEPAARKKTWLVDTYYKDTGGKPPQGMARLHVPANASDLADYGIRKAS